MHDENPLSAAAKGALAGLIGTAALTVAMKVGSTVLLQRGLIPTLPAPARDDPAEQPTGKLADKVAGGVAGASLDKESMLLAGQAIHWTYGTTWGAAYGIAQSILRWPALPAGALFGSLVGAVGSTVVPALGVSPPPTRQPLSINALMMALHLVYGWVIALTFRALTRHH